MRLHLLSAAAIAALLAGPALAQRDGSASNPPGTAVGRAFSLPTQGNERSQGDGGSPGGGAATGANPGIMGSTQPNAAASMGSRNAATPRGDNSATSDLPPGSGAGTTTTSPNNPQTEGARAPTGTEPGPRMGSGRNAEGTSR